MAEDIMYDLDSYDIVTQALMELINDYPGLNNTEVTFSVLASESGVAMFPSSGAAIQTNDEDVTGFVSQTCMYPFTIVYRAAGLSEKRKQNIKEWLDNIGKWLEKQTVTINGVNYKLDEYPTLSGNREFIEISRTSPGYLLGTNEDKVEDWVISIQAQYKNEFYK